MALRSAEFVAERQKSWEELRRLVSKIKRRGLRSLSPAEAIAFPYLYCKTCTDGETAKTLGLSPDVIDYINNLVQQAHSILYSRPPLCLRQIWNFFRYNFPLSVAKNILPILFVFGLFFGLAIATCLVVLNDPPSAAKILGQGEIAFLKEIWAKYPIRSAQDNIQMTSYYIANNVSICFACLVLGIGFGIPTVLLVAFNAFNMGASAGIVINAGYGENFFNFVIAHSALELLGLCLTAGAGLAIGIAAIRATSRRRSQEVAAKAREVIPLMWGAAFFITLAAFVEGFISASGMPLIFKLSIFLISLLFVMLYALTFVLGRLKKAFRQQLRSCSSKE